LVKDFTFCAVVGLARVGSDAAAGARHLSLMKEAFCAPSFTVLAVPLFFFLDKDLFFRYALFFLCKLLREDCSKKIKEILEV
jgi:hypothetical protein